MNLHLTDRVAAVAAGSAGLGFATALTLAQEGCRVAICARTPARLAAAAERIRTETGVEVLALPFDMADLAAPAAFVEASAAHFGRLDIVVANAGGPPSGPFTAMNDEQWLGAIQQNLLATARMFRAALPWVTASDQGRLIAITSISARQPLDNMVLSNTARAGVHALVKTLSKELAKGSATANLVCPGLTRTDRILELAQQTANREGITVDAALARQAAGVPMGRLGDPMDFGAAVAYLCGRQANFISGSALYVDGAALSALP